MLRSFLILVLFAASAVAQEAGSPQLSRQLAPQLPQAEWFNAQRAYPFRAIPQEAMGKALRQKRALTSQFHPQSDFVAQFANAWSPLGPAGALGAQGVESGHVSAIVTDSRNPDSLYVAASGGGVWHSSDGGATWQPLSDSVASPISGSLALDERTGMLWYGTGDQWGGLYGAGVFRSANGGLTWIDSNGWDSAHNKPQFAGGITPRIFPHPSDPRTVFAARNSGLWRSQDGGDSWSRLIYGYVSDAAIDPSNPNRVYAALGVTLGDTWNGLYRSNDGGINWEVLLGLPSGPTVGRISIALAPSNPSIIYAALARSSDQQLWGIFRSSDGGGSWSLLPAPALLFDSAGQGQGYFDNVLAIDPRDPNTIYAGGLELWKSSDAGATWRVLSLAATGSRVIHEDQFCIAFKPGNPDTIYVGNEGGIYTSPDGGNTWRSLNNGLAITQFNSVAVDPQNFLNVLGGTQGQGLVQLSGGSIWTELLRGDAGEIVFDTGNPGAVFVTKQRVSLMRSAAGEFFSFVSAGITNTDRASFYPPIALQPGNPSVVYLGTHRLWASSNGGTDWRAISGDLTNGGTLTAIAVASDGSIYTGSSDGKVAVSNGLGLARIGTGNPNRWVTSIAIDPRFPGTAYLTVSGFGSGHIFKTIDAGGTWIDIGGNLPDAPANDVAVDPQGPIYVATDIGVFRSEDGASWASFNAGLPSAFVTSLALHPQSATLTAGTYGRSVYRISLQPPQSGPILLAQGVVNAASFQPALAPGAIVSLFGNRLAPAPATPAGGALPTSLGGTSVTINGQLAPLFFVSASQINFQCPFEVTGSEALAQVTTRDGIASILVPVMPTVPGIFSGSAIHSATGVAVDAAHPAIAGEVLGLFATGLGNTVAAVATGVPAPVGTLALTTIPVLLNVGDRSAKVLFGGLAPGFVGLYQVNFVVPDGLSGSLPITLSAGGRISNAVPLALR